ncbi:hypothetical protein CQA53_01870 [Helicobacter didelphidarum]|uniref:Beta-lactamase n=1 Tax=Helicobacter didelphidarum TaxID=2040648 RepID=A0A3D8IPK0_9HELI|nr:SEL1-like repeat protein [Helicobacter didelphidarum]RDU67033.1 hypothetical protein CQA53_01870 [Helicobacter didelphidarum]
MQHKALSVISPFYRWKLCYKEQCFLLRSMRILLLGIIYLCFFAYQSYAVGYNNMVHSKLADSKGNFVLWHQQCSQKDYEACYLLGRAYYEGYGILSNQIKAEYFLNLACKKNIIEACLTLSENPNNNQDTRDLIAIYQQTCNLDHIESCKKLVGILMQNISIDSNKNDKEHVYTLLGKICSLDFDTKCKKAQDFRKKFMSAESDIELYFEESLKVCQKAIDEHEDNLAVCGIVGSAYANAKGVKKDKVKAIKYFAIACKDNNEYCYKEILDPLLNP